MKELNTLQAILTDVPKLVKGTKDDTYGKKDIILSAPVPFKETQVNRIILESCNEQFSLILGLWLTVSKKFIQTYSKENCTLADIEIVFNSIKESFLKLKADKGSPLNIDISEFF